jgi:lipopolysaccharide/colanic/teichoic acid biosynthesis glycosyltransferase
MSIVGPRPVTEEELVRYSNAVDLTMHAVRGSLASGK